MIRAAVSIDAEAFSQPFEPATFAIKFPDIGDGEPGR
jgi:hypothetical protein